MLGGAAVLGLLVLLALEATRPDFLDAPAPELLPDDPRPPIARSSVLSVPIVIPLDRLVALLEEAVPREFGSLEERHDLPDNDRAAIAFALERGPFEVRMDGPVARVEATVEYAMRAYYDPPILPELSGSCGTGDDGLRRLKVVIEAPLRLDAEWALATRSRLVELVPASDEERDRCEVTFLDVDVTDRLVEGARAFLAAQEATIDSVAGAIDLRDSFEAWWATLRDPIQLADSVWLVVGPDSIRQGRISGSGSTLRVDVALDARPTIVVGARPPQDTTSLPRLGAGDFEPGLDILVEGRAEYGATADILRKELSGIQLEHEGRTLRLDSLDMLGIGGGRVALEVWVSGDRSGHLYFTGTPSYDESEGLVSIPDLDFDVPTEHLVVAAASWITSFGLRGMLRERARWPAAPITDWLRGWLEQGLNRDLSDDLRVVGEVDSLYVGEVYALRDHFLVRVAARASAEVSVRP